VYHQRRSQHEVTFVFRHGEAPFEETEQCRGRHETKPKTAQLGAGFLKSL
jgi:hypothetical protein